MATNNNTLPIPEFHGEEDYKYWSIKLKKLLIGKGLWDIVQEGYSYLADWNTLQPNDKDVKRGLRKRIPLHGEL